MIRRVFSKNTYNGYHLVSLRGEGEDPSPIGLFKKSTEKDEHGFLVLEDRPKCPHPGRYLGGWDNWLYVYFDCQKCPWVYRTGDSYYKCLLHSMERIVPGALVNERIGETEE